MSFCPFKFMLMLALGAAVMPAAAQEAIIFSKPADAANKADSLLDNPQRLDTTEDHQAPRQLGNNFSPARPPPMQYPSRQDASIRDALNKRKNWTLLTPEQILGVQTSDQILGLTERDRQNKGSLEEQFLLRKKTTSASTTTPGKTPSTKNDASFFDQGRREKSPFASGPFMQSDDKMLPDSDSSKYLKQLLNANGGSGFSKSERKPDAAWTSVFAQPTPLKQTPAQLADRDRFRAMMEQAALPDKDKVVAPTRFSVKPADNPAESHSSFFQRQSAFNPAGRSVATLEEKAARPTGIQPLPGITGPIQTTPTTRPEWQAQLPPWLTDGPKARKPRGL